MGERLLYGGAYSDATGVRNPITQWRALEVRMADEWIDVSVPLRPGMAHWPGDPAFRLTRPQELSRGDRCTVSEIALGVHTGTHMDAPSHFIAGGASMDALPMDAVVGSARVIPIDDPRIVSVTELKPHGIEAGERILFKTRNSPRCWDTDVFIEDFVYIPRDTAAYLVERGVRTVGIDYLSVAGYEQDTVETHRALLEGGVWIIEGLNLTEVPPGPCELLCLPMRIAGAEGAPARALLRPSPRA